MLRYDPARPISYPDNGRLLTDDVGDLNVAIFTNGRVTEDGVGPHDDLQPKFPYLGPHTPALAEIDRRLAGSEPSASPS
jgi:hypothetical protein